jgi:hypothetical protein
MSIKVMTRVWESAPVKGGRLLILLALADFSDDAGRSWPSVATLARKARLTERQAQRCLIELTDQGLLQVSLNAGPHGTNVYEIHDGGSTCKGCGAMFAGRDKRQEYCTAACRNAANQRAYYHRNAGGDNLTGGDIGVSQMSPEPLGTAKLSTEHSSPSSASRKRSTEKLNDSSPRARAKATAVLADPGFVAELRERFADRDFEWEVKKWLDHVEEQPPRGNYKNSLRNWLERSLPVGAYDTGRGIDDRLRQQREAAHAAKVAGA